MMILLQRNPKLGPWMFGAILLLCACFAHGQNAEPYAACSTAASPAGSGRCYVDCRNGSSANPGTFDQPWRTPLSIGLHTFTAGDAIYLHRDCTWNSGILMTSGYKPWLQTTTWIASYAYPAGATIMPDTANGHSYANSGACTSGGSQPTFPTNGTSVSDGGCTWTDQGAATWSAATPSFAIGAFIQPAPPNGDYYENVSGILCAPGYKIPAWSTSGGTVNDNTCSWQDQGLIPKNVGTLGSNISIDSYGGYNSPPGTGAPPHLTGLLPIAATYWCKGNWTSPGNVPTCTPVTGNVWTSRPLFDEGGPSSSDYCGTDHNCVPCVTLGITYSCLDQAANVLNFVRFGTVWGNDQEVAAELAMTGPRTALTQDRDWYFDPGIGQITNISLTGNVVTVILAPYSLAQNNALPGSSITFSNVGTNSFLNGQTVTIATVGTNSFTAPYSHANVASAADTGIVTYQGDKTAQSLAVYCTCTGGVTPDVYYGQVAPIVISGQDSPVNGAINLLNLNGVSYVSVQHLLLDWYDSIGVQVQGASDHIWLANMAADSYVENAQYRFDGAGRMLCVPANANGGNCSLTGQLSTPPQPTVTPVGTAGSTTYSYAIVANDGGGGVTAAGPVRTITTGNATLSATNKNGIAWGTSSFPNGGLAPTYSIYRTQAAGTSPTTTGMIASGLTSSPFYDVGQPADGSAAPALNTTGTEEYTQIGFWMQPSGTPTDIHLFNVDANMNYVGFKFGNGAGTSAVPKYELKNCRAYGNRTYGLTDDTGGGVNHDFCHFYGNNLATSVETDYATDCVTGSACASGSSPAPAVPYPVPMCAPHEIGCPPRITVAKAPLSGIAPGSGPGYTDLLAAIANQPNVSAVSVLVGWNSIESNTIPTCNNGIVGGCQSYIFTTLDAKLALWAAAGKIVNLIISPVTEGGQNTYTPTYVFSTAWNALLSTPAPNPQDVAYCTNYPGSGALSDTSANISDAIFDNKGIPVSYEAPFQVAYYNFIQAVVAHYNSPGGGVPNIGYIRFGPTQGGEASPLCNAYYPGYSKAVYLNYVLGLMNWEAGTGAGGDGYPPNMTLLADTHAVGVIPDEGYADTEAQYAVLNGKMGFGTQGFQQSDITNYPNCTADWCRTFMAYGGQASLNGGTPITLELQTVGVSDPTNVLQTGSLATLLPFARKLGANYVEIYPCDAMLPYATATVFEADCPSGGLANTYAAYAGAYQAAFTAFTLPGGAGLHPLVQNWKRWPAYVTLTYDDPGLVAYSDEYINQLMPMISAKIGASNFSLAIVTGGECSLLNTSVGGVPCQTGNEVAKVQGWINAGWDAIAHSVSHQYWNPPSTTPCNDVAGPIPCDAFNLGYVGSQASSSLVITHSGTGGTLTLSGSPYDPNCYHQWDLTPIAPGGTGLATQINTIGNIISTLRAQPGCWSLDSVAYNGENDLGATVPGATGIYTKGQAHAWSLADTSVTLPSTSAPGYAACQANPATAGCVLFNETYLETDEMGWANSFMNDSFTGLPTNRYYIMPGTYGDSITENIANSLGYRAVRGTGSLKPCCGASTTLANGYDSLDILSQGIVPNLQNLNYAQMRRYMLSDLFKNALWGRPIGFFWHINELPPDQVENMLDALVQGGATLKSNTGLLNTLLLNAPASGAPSQGQCVANDLVPPVGVSDTGSAYVPGSFYACPGLPGTSVGAGGTSWQDADWRETASSPTVGTGTETPGSAFQYDMRGNNRNGYGAGWDIGAFQYIPMSMPRQ